MWKPAVNPAGLFFPKRSKTTHLTRTSLKKNIYICRDAAKAKQGTKPWTTRSTGAARRLLVKRSTGSFFGSSVVWSSEILKTHIEHETPPGGPASWKILLDSLRKCNRGDKSADFEALSNHFFFFFFLFFWNFFFFFFLNMWKIFNLKWSLETWKLWGMLNFYTTSHTNHVKKKKKKLTWRFLTTRDMRGVTRVSFR